jgi:hypothetical protein
MNQSLKPFRPVFTVTSNEPMRIRRARVYIHAAPTTYAAHYNRERPHRRLALLPPGPASPPTASAIQRRDRLGGLLHEYYEAAA